MMNTLEVLIKKEIELDNKLELVREMIKEEKVKQDGTSTISVSTKSNAVKTNDEFNKKDSLSDKIRLAFKQEQRFLHIREVVTFIKAHEPDSDEKTLKRRLSTNLNRMKRNGILTNVKHNMSLLNVFWGSINWVDENNKIKSGYEYKEDQIFNKTKQVELIL